MSYKIEKAWRAFTDETVNLLIKIINQSANKLQITQDLQIFNFGIATIDQIVYQIASSLPPLLFLEENQELKELFQIGLTQELIIFLPQEDINSEYFSNNLINFTDEVKAKLLNNYYVRAA